MSKLPSPAYLRQQAARCQRLSALCMDLGVARDLRLMADEYLADASRLEQSERSAERVEATHDRRDSWQATRTLQTSRSS
jgi:hypothetical protein